MLVAVSLLAISLSFLVYRSPPSTWLAFITRARVSATRTMPQSAQRGREEPHTPAEERGIELQTQAKHHTETALSPSSSPQTTPKALPNDAQHAPPVPSFTLNEHENEESDDDGEEDNLPPPSFPALNSAQRASAPTPSFSMPPPTKPTLMAPPARPATSSLMPPPRVAPSNLRALPTSPQSMRVPTTGPLPNRGPVPNRGPPTSNGSLGIPSAGPTLKTPNARGKVLLSPGHSPLDWANLQRSSKNLSGVDSLVRVTPAMLKEKNGRKGRPAWSSYQGKVYNISPYLPFHPGGEGELRRAAGKDGTKLFMEVHPWVNWENMLGECMVGILVSEEQAAPKDSGGTLEDMD
ncbi:hypothetical protein BKA66DRAFT_435945 [Pyrenochaeta sp. MPI-SDFR-AT-0127]|nr:hypothetical protein BKA66DRAFT_435945 [Pyrenochaeta sp. MPI-SDFR-AT-0127]